MSIIVNEPVTTSAPATGTLNDSAVWVNNGAGLSYIKLTAPSSPSDGEFYYNITMPTDFTCTFDFWAGGGTGADATDFFWGSSAIEKSYSDAFSQYTASYDEFNQRIRILWNNTELAFVTSITNIGNSTWHTAKIQVIATNTIKVTYDGTLELNITDSTRTMGGNFMGWNAFCGFGANNEHRIRNLLITNDVTGKVILHTLGLLGVGS